MSFFASHQDFYATAGQTDFDVSLQFLDATHIKVTVNGLRTPFEWLTTSRLRLLEACADHDSVRIYRDTPIDDALVTFTPGAVLTDEALNTATLQAILKLQELTDSYGAGIDDAKIRLANNLGIVTNAVSVFDELVRTNVFGQDLIDRFNQIISDVALDAETIIDNALKYIEVRDLIYEVGYLNGVPLGAVITELAQTSFANGVAIANAVASLSARTNAALSGVYTWQDAYADNARATANTITYLLANAGTNRAEFLDSKSAFANNIVSMTQRIDAQVSRTDNAFAQIGTLSNTTTNQFGATANSLSVMNATFNGKLQAVNDNAAIMNASLLVGIADAKNIAATANGVLANAIAVIAGKVDIPNGQTVTGAISTSQTLALNASNAVANTVGALAVEYRSNAGVMNSTVQAHTGLIASANSTATNATNIATSIANGALAVTLNSGTTLAGLTGSLVSQINGIKSQFGDANAYVLAQIAASTGPTSSIANAMTVLRSDLNANAATITQLFATSNGLVNRATLTLASGSGSNKVVTGYSILNGPNTSQISFLASVFSVVDTVGGTPITVFEVSGGFVRCPNLIAGNIFADTITANKFVTGAVDGRALGNNVVNNYHITSGAIATATNATSPSAVSVATSGVSGTTPDLTVQTLSITTKGGAVTILGGFNGYQITSVGTGGTEMNNVGTPPTLWVIRDGSVIYSCALQTPLCGYTGGGGTEGFTRDGVYKASYYHPVLFGEANLAAGTHTYELRVTGIPANIQSGTAGTAYGASARHLSVFELVKTGT